MNKFDNRHPNHDHPIRGNDHGSHEADRVIGLDAVRLARSGKRPKAAPVAAVSMPYPPEPERVNRHSPALSADILRLASGPACSTLATKSNSLGNSSVPGTDPASPSSVSSGTVSTDPTSSSPASSAFPNLSAIAREPDYARRRSELVNAMAFYSGTKVSERLVDHQMIVSGLAAGHGCNEDDSIRDDIWPLGSSMDDPAVIVGLVLHHTKHFGSRGMPIPPSLMRQLEHHVALGSPAARLVRDWLKARSCRNDRQHLQVHDGGRS